MASIIPFNEVHPYITDKPGGHCIQPVWTLGEEAISRPCGRHGNHLVHSMSLVHSEEPDEEAVPAGEYHPFNPGRSNMFCMQKVQLGNKVARCTLRPEAKVHHPDPWPSPKVMEPAPEPKIDPPTQQAFICGVPTHQAESQLESWFQDRYRVVQMGFVEGHGFWFLLERTTRLEDFSG